MNGKKKRIFRVEIYVLDIYLPNSKFKIYITHLPVMVYEKVEFCLNLGSAYWTL
jgi:hypothetical protein